MEIFSKWLTQDSGEKLEFFAFLAFKENRPWNNVSWPSSKKTSLPTLKNKDFTKSPYGDFFKGVNPWFWSKIRIFSLLPFKQNRLWNNVSWPSVYKTSVARLNNKDFAKSPYGDFSKGLTHESGQQLEFFSLLPFKQNRPLNNVCSQFS